MKTAHLIVLAGLAVALPATSQAQVAGSTFLGSSTPSCAMSPWAGAPRVRSSGHPVFNDMNERIG